MFLSHLLFRILIILCSSAVPHLHANDTVPFQVATCIATLFLRPLALHLAGTLTERPLTERPSDILTRMECPLNICFQWHFDTQLLHPEILRPRYVTCDIMSISVFWIVTFRPYFSDVIQVSSCHSSPRMTWRSPPTHGSVCRVPLPRPSPGYRQSDRTEVHQPIYQCAVCPNLT